MRKMKLESIITCVRTHLSDGPNSFHYIDFLDENKEDVKRDVRDLSIDVILDEIGSDVYTKIKNEILEKSLSMPEISVKLKSQIVKTQKYKHIDDLNGVVFNYFNSLSSVKHPLNTNHDVTIRSSSSDNLSKKFMSSCIRGANLIAYQGRIGPGNVIMVGKDLSNLLIESESYHQNKSLGSTAGIEYFYNPYLASNKVLVVRKNREISIGLNLVLDEENKMYCLFDSGDYLSNVFWFDFNI